MKFGCAYDDPQPNWAVPWDDPKNSRFANSYDAVCCFTPSARANRWTNVVAVTGSKTAFNLDQPIRIDELPFDTIFLISVNNLEQHWMRPGDVDRDWIVTELDKPSSESRLGISSRGFHVAFADGVVFLLRHNVPAETLMAFIDPNVTHESTRDSAFAGYIIEKYPARLRKSLIEGCAPQKVPAGLPSSKK